MKKLSFLKCFVETLPVASESLVKTLRATSLLGMMVLAPIGATAQVTIGSGDLPAATLDVVATKTDGTTAEGIIAPRLTLAQLKAADAQYLAAQTGTVVYVTDATGGTTAKTVNVTAVGYYYFDGSVWQTVKNPYTAANGLTLNGTAFELGGTLDKATTITQGTNPLSFTSTATNGFSVDGTTFSVDAANNRVGIGTNAPTQALDVNGQIRIRGGSPAAGKVLSSQSDGTAVWSPLADLGTRQDITVIPTTVSGHDGSVYLLGGLSDPSLTISDETASVWRLHNVFDNTTYSGGSGTQTTTSGNLFILFFLGDCSINIAVTSGTGGLTKRLIQLH